MDRPFLPLDAKGRKVWVVSEKVYTGSLINYRWHLTADNEIRLSNTDKARTVNEKFEMTEDILTLQKFSEFKFMPITATSNISRGDGIFC